MGDQPLGRGLHYKHVAQVLLSSTDVIKGKYGKLELVQCIFAGMNTIH